MPVSILKGRLSIIGSVFWVSHIVGVATLLLIYIAFFVLSNDKPILNLYLAMLWIPLFTLSVVPIRRSIKKKLDQSYSLAQLSLSTLVMCGLLSLAITALLAAGSLPIFWHDLYSPEILARKNTTIEHSLSKHLGMNLITNFLFLASWASLYLGLTSYRKSKNTEIYNLRLEKQLVNAQVEYLNQQLNPHFLFNSLNNIRFLIHENPEQADTAVTMLSELLRYSLNANKQTKVSVSAEMHIVSQYFNIVELHLEDRLILDIFIDQSIQAALIPPMSIQLLAENAIKHGVEGIRVPSILYISITDEDSQVKVVVKNYFSAGNQSNYLSTGTGLKNLKERLSLLYSDAATFMVSAEDLVFRVEFRIPKEF